MPKRLLKLFHYGDNMSNIRKFKAVGENIMRIAEKLVENQNICKLLFYTNKDPLTSPDLTEEQRMDLLHENILIVPKVPESDNIKGSYILALYDSFDIDSENSEFKDVELLFIVVCPPKEWVVNEPSLRPFLIMSEIDEMFNGQKLANIGKIKFVRANRFVLTPQLTGYAMAYSTFEFN